MKTIFAHAIFLLAVIAAAGFSGCVKKHPELAPPPPAATATATSAPATAVSTPATTATSAPPAATSATPSADYKSGLAALAEGKYRRALGMFTAALKQSPGNPKIIKSFDEALAGLIEHGNAAYAQEKPETAGKRWKAALRGIEWAETTGRRLPAVRADVEARLNRLTSEQMEKGLLLYRKEDLPGAIAAWKVILAYDPENKEAAKAVQTASTQLENLKKAPPAQ